MKKVVIVTGGNKGIGFEVCQQLHRLGLTVILTARDNEKGQKAAKKIGCFFHQLDVTDKNSIISLKKHVKTKFAEIHVLVNNAAIIDIQKKSIFETEFEGLNNIMQTNFYGPLLVSQVLFPLMKKGARIINVSSKAGQLSGATTLSSMIRTPVYGISKTALNALTIKMSTNLKGIKVNSVSPGWTRTDMGTKFALRPVRKGAETIVWLATAKKIPNGKFLHDKKEIKW